MVETSNISLLDKTLPVTVIITSLSSAFAWIFVFSTSILGSQLAKAVLTDVDILALLVNHDELITVNLPLIGEVKIPKSQITGESAHSWFLLPKRAMVHANACDYYKFKTSVWYFRLDELKPPLTAARENWGLLERKSMTGIEEQFGLNYGKKV